MKRQVARDGAVLHTLYILSYCSWLHKALHLTLLQISAPTDPNTSGVKASFITNSKHMDDQMTHKLIRQTSPPPPVYPASQYCRIYCNLLFGDQFKTNKCLSEAVCGTPGAKKCPCRQEDRKKTTFPAAGHC